MTGGLRRARWSRGVFVLVPLAVAAAVSAQSEVPARLDPAERPAGEPIERLRIGVTMGAESAATGDWTPTLGELPADASAPGTERIERGRALYTEGTCTTCHHFGGRGTGRGPALDDRSWLHGDGSLAAIRAVITSGVPRSEHRGRQTPYEMRPLGGMELTPPEVDAIAAYVWSLSRGVSAESLLAEGSELRGEAAPLTRIAFGSCAHQEVEQPIWDDVLELEPDLLLLLGDNVYADTHDDGERRAAYSALAAKPGFAALRRNTPILATWDGTDDVGAEFPEKEASRRAFLDFLGEPESSPRRRREGTYSADRFGPPGRIVQVILLDTRWSRSPLVTVADGLEIEAEREEARSRRAALDMGPYLPNPDPDARLLGEEQWAWLEERLREPAQLRLIATSIPFAMELTGWEAWANFPFERRRLISLIAETGARGVVFLSGDTHWAELSVIEEGALGAPYDLWDLTSSGLTEEWQDVSPNRRRIAGPHVGPNFGLLELEWPEPGGEDEAPAVRLQIRALGDEVVLERHLSL